MGQQQILLLVLTVILVAVAIIVGIFLFLDEAAAANRDAVVLDLQNLVVAAQKHYRVPTVLGGGGNTFDNFRFPPTLASNGNGTYQHIKQSHDKNHIHFEGNGVEKGSDGINLIQIEVRVEIDTVKLTEHN